MMYRMCNGELQQQSTHTLTANNGTWEVRHERTGWLSVGKIIRVVPLGLPDCNAIVYVSIRDDSRFTYVFKQVPDDCAKFGAIKFWKKVKAIRENADSVVLSCKKRKTGKKARLSTLTIGNGEGVSEYSLRSAGINIEHKKDDYSIDEEREEQKFFGETKALTGKDRKIAMQIKNAEYSRKRELERKERAKIEKKQLEEIKIDLSIPTPTAQPTIIKGFRPIIVMLPVLWPTLRMVQLPAEKCRLVGTKIVAAD